MNELSNTHPVPPHSTRPPDCGTADAGLRQQRHSKRTRHGSANGESSHESNVQPIRVEVRSKTGQARRDHIPGSAVLLGFTERQWAVVDLVAKGYKNRELGRMVGLTEDMVKNYICVIYDRLGLWNRVELAMWYEKLWFELLLREGQCQ